MRDGTCVFAEVVGNSYLVDGRSVVQFNILGTSEQGGDGEPRLAERADLDPLRVLRPS
jgi:hypothetical protein